MINRPTYLVAVSGQSIYMGYSPTNLTLCTGGNGVLANTPRMTMFDAPGSPNDSSPAKYHRHMLFADGSSYYKLDCHTGSVSAWTSFIGTDAVSGEAITGLMPFSTDREDTIASQSGGQPRVSGNVTAQYPNGSKVALQGTTADAFYTVTGTSFSGGNTTFTLTPNPGLAAGGGTIARVTSKGRIGGLWRRRAVITGLDGDPNQWFMSASGDFRNWDYAPPTPSATMAVAGAIDDVVTAFVPFNDDVAAFFGQNSVWVIRGDPADGGQIDNVSRAIGCSGPDAWTFDTDGNLYFFGNDGLYKMTPQGVILPRISAGKYDTTFAKIDRTVNRILLQWDKKRSYLYIFVVKDAADAVNEPSYIFDARAEAFWPIKLPDGNGPTAVCYFEAEAANDRGVLLGGRDGYVRGFRDGRTNDRSTNGDVAIDSYIRMGPFALADGQDFRVDDFHFKLAGGSGPVQLQVYSGNTPEQAAKSREIRAATTLRLDRARLASRKIAAQSLVFALAQNTLHVTWGYEGGFANVKPSGKTRRVR
jgi:hypothetical protein